MSEEKVTKETQIEIVRSLFMALLGRGPSAAEEATLAAGLVDLSSIPAMIRRFVDSPERKRRANIVANSNVPLFVPPGHFYSPVVDPTLVGPSVPRRRGPPPDSVPGVSLDMSAMTDFWRENLLPHIKTAPFPDDKGDLRYYFRNPAFSYGDALILHAMLRHMRPSRVIEVGSGYSSACLLDTAFDAQGFPCDITFIEPFPELLRSLMRPGDEAKTKILDVPIQSVPLEVFKTLGAGDILFIDSTHVLKTGSDVTYELTQVLPSLAPGVIVHLHDIFYPFEYGYDWVISENRSWNEVYAVRAFLTFNSEFEVICFNDMFIQMRTKEILEECPRFALNSGGSLWLRRRVAES